MYNSSNTVWISLMSFYVWVTRQSALQRMFDRSNALYGRLTTTGTDCYVDGIIALFAFTACFDGGHRSIILHPTNLVQMRCYQAFRICSFVKKLILVHVTTRVGQFGWQPELIRRFKDTRNVAGKRVKVEWCSHSCVRLNLCITMQPLFVWK